MLRAVQVHKAVDTVAFTDVACKLHHLNPNWPEARKQSYVRHTVREYHIHKALDHPNVVRLHDVFELDANTFCTVLDFCPGGAPRRAALSRRRRHPPVSRP